MFCFVMLCFIMFVHMYVHVVAKLKSKLRVIQNARVVYIFVFHSQVNIITLFKVTFLAVSWKAA